MDADGFDEVTVAYTTYYQITSRRYGEHSTIRVGFEEDYKHVAQAMKLTTHYGGTERTGAVDDEVIDTALVELVRAKYQQTGAEHASQAGLLAGVGFTAHDVPPYVRQLLASRRRGW